MTTADIVFAQPGNPDRLRDYEQNARTIFWALLVGDSNSFAGGVFARCVQRVFLARAPGAGETG